MSASEFCHFRAVPKAQSKAMRRFPIPKNKWQQLIMVCALIALAVMKANQMLKAPGTAKAPKSPRTAGLPRSGSAERMPDDAPDSTKKSSAKTTTNGAWKTFEGCTLAEHRNNDGDSFDLMAGGQKLTVRLYFVDSPEKRRHQYNSDRIADQARYFGCSEDHAIATGAAARDFAEGFLRNDSVTFTTRMEPVYDSERLYGFVSVGGLDMGETLVARGLARIHTKGEDGPVPGSERDEKERLYQLEREAKAKGLGGWRR